MLIDFNQIRDHKHSKQAGFEELCCQLAAWEHAPDGRFYRTAAPDAGVECYWQFPSGDEWAWQAKFFTRVPGPSQWRQIDQSVADALDHHPRMTRYIVCIPIDRPDERDGRRRSMMDRWHEHVAKWAAAAGSRGMTVDFEYWGQFEITERLTRREHAGRSLYWFAVDLLSDNWLQRHLAIAIEAAGPRYTRELNVALPIAQIFDTLGGDSATLRASVNRLLKRAHQAVRWLLDGVGADALPSASLIESLPTFAEQLAAILEAPTAQVPWEQIVSHATALHSTTWSCIEGIRDSTQQASAEEMPSVRPEIQIGRLREVVESLEDLLRFAETPEAALINVPALLITGGAGVGKTHLLCDVAERRLSAGMPTLILLGQRSTAAHEPWTQIIQYLGLTCNRDQLLGALDAAGEASGCRALILLDALNEGAGAEYWRDQLPALLTHVRQYQHVGIAVSVRSSYRDRAIREDLVPQHLVEIVHAGFAGHEYDAVRAFFDHHGIELPRTPLLEPEFSNPLFLKLACRTLQREGRRTFEPGMRGISAVFDAYLKELNSRAIASLGFYPNDDPVYRSVEALSREMAKTGRTWLVRDEARLLANDSVSTLNHTGSLFDMLRSEGLLHEDVGWNAEANDWVEMVSFAYERFTDHRVVSYLLNESLHGPEGESLSNGFDLASVLPNLRGPYRMPQGWIEALAIQVPERIGRELHELLPNCSDPPLVHGLNDAFIQSLIWRRRDAFTDATLRHVNERILSRQGTLHQFLEAMLTVACDELHPYNAERLHSFLMAFTMPDRDAWWTLFINERYSEHRSYGTDTAIARLIDWAWHSDQVSVADPPVRRLCALVLSWFLTSSNRYLRDAATKALVGLLQHDLDVGISILAEFADVDDPYVAERLMAAAYGCAMRSPDSAAVLRLAEFVYSRIFAHGNPPADLLLRDYARGIVELAVHLDPEFPVHLELVHPPYRSAWPESFLSDEEFAARGDLPHEPSGERMALHRIHASLDWGDFARYIIGTNWGSLWSATRRSEPRPLRNLDILNAFTGLMTPNQSSAWKKHLRARKKASDLARDLTHLKYCETEPEHWGMDAEQLRAAVVRTEAALKRAQATASRAKTDLRTCLKRRLWSRYNQEIAGLLDCLPEDYQRLDMSLAQRWIFQKVLDLGWTTDRFGDHDDRVGRSDHSGRSSHKAERIGKKYQWIGFYEFMARLMDNFHYVGHGCQEAPEPFVGPWQCSGYVRDIDPSSLVDKSGRSSLGNDPTSWWSPVVYGNWDTQTDDAPWMEDERDLPAPTSLILVKNPADGSEWLNLSGFWVWHSPGQYSWHHDNEARRELFYILDSYIVRKSEAARFRSWAGKQDFYGRWMPKPGDDIHVFLGEYFWSPAFHFHDDPYYGHTDWSRYGGREKLPVEVLITAREYLWEHSTYDCSIEDTIHAAVPSRLLAQGLGLRTPGVEGRFVDASNQLTIFDPSVAETGPEALLVRREALESYLAKNDYSIIWILLGEKNAYRDDREHWPGRLVISGVYDFRDGIVRGGMKSRLHKRG